MRTATTNTTLQRRRFLGGLAAGGAGALLAACGGGKSDGGGGSSGGASNPSSAAVQTATAGLAAATGTPKTGGTLVTWSTTPPDNPGLDNILNFSGEMSNFASYIYPKLTKFKVGPEISPVRYVNELDLAASMEQADPTTYIFKLNDKAKWQDVAPLNGRQLTAEDVVFNFNLYLQKSINRILLQPHLDKVEAVDKATVRFKLKQPLAPFLTYVGHPTGPFIYPPELKENDQTREKTAAAGAFLLDRYEVGTAVHFKRNPNYYKAPKPYVDGLTVSILRDPSTIAANIRNGALDFNTWTTSAVPHQFADQLRQATPGASWVRSEFPNFIGECFDLGDPRFKDERVRQAFSVAMDRDARFAILGPGTKYTGPLTIYEPWWLDPTKDPQISQFYKRDVQKAKQLLAAAGFPSGMKDVQYIYNAGINTTNADEAAVMQSSLKEAGIELTLQPLQNTEWFQTGAAGNAPNKFYRGVGVFNTDPSEGLALVYHPDSLRNPITNRQEMKNDTMMLDLMKKIEGELDATKRKALVDDIQRYLAGKAYSIGVATVVSNYYASKRMKNMQWVMHYAFGPIIADTWIDPS